MLQIGEDIKTNDNGNGCSRRRLQVTMADSDVMIQISLKMDASPHLFQISVDSKLLLIM